MRFCVPQGWVGGGVSGEGGSGGLQFELDELVLQVLEVMKEFVQQTAQSSGAAAETGPDESAGWFQPWRAEMSKKINNTDVHFMFIETKEATLENVRQQQCFIPIH